MKQKLTLKNVFILAMMLLASASFTSCNNGSSSSGFDSYEKQDPTTTGLCGTKWVLQNVIGIAEKVTYDTYIFNATGNGLHEYTEDGEVKQISFTWESYDTGKTRRLLMLNIGGGQSYTYYNISSDNRLYFTSDNTIVYEYAPETDISDDELIEDDPFSDK